jgi:hypothetical protein
LDPATYTVSYCTTQYISIQSNLKLSSWETDSHSTGLEIPLCWDPKVHYHIHGPAALPYPEPGKFSLHPHILFF